MGLDFPTILAMLHHVIDNPIDRPAQRFAQHRAAGLSDGRQTFERPGTRAAVAQLTHQDAVRQEDQIHVAGLATAFPELTIAHAQMLLAVAMEALGAAPAMAVHAEDAADLPMGLVRHEDLSRCLAVVSFPQDHQAHAMIDAGDADTLAEVQLFLAIDDHGLAIFGFDQRRDLLGLERLPLERHLSVELQIADVTAAVIVNVVEIVRVGEPAIERKILGNFVFDHPVDQIAEHRVVIDERIAFEFAMLPFDEPAEVQRIMFPAPGTSGTDIVGDQIIMGDLMALLGVIPEPVDILDELAVVVDQHVVQSDHAVRAVPRGRIGLQPVEPLTVELFDIPVHFGQPAVEARLIRGLGELPADRRDVLAFGDHQPGQIRFGHDGRIFDDRGHDAVLHDRFWRPANLLYRQIAHEIACEN